MNFRDLNKKNSKYRKMDWIRAVERVMKRCNHTPHDSRRDVRLG